MTTTTATFPGLTTFDGPVIAFGDCRRLFDGFAVGLATVATAGAIVGSVTLAAVWMVGTALSTNSHIHMRPPVGPAAIALADPLLSGRADVFGSARIWTGAAYAPNPTRVATLAPALAPKPTRVATLTPALAPKPAPLAAQPSRAITPHVASASSASNPAQPPAKLETPVAPGVTREAKLTPAAPPLPAAEHVARVPLPRPHPPRRDIAAAPVATPAPRVAAVVAPPADAAAAKHSPQRQAHNKAMALPAPDSRTAVYDIAAHTVYLPNGERLEAHSGLGRWLDNPRFVAVKDRGPTPPNVYDLTLRKELFHGVRAIRLNPVDDGNMFGRDGMLAHTYMLGPSGQSNGCVSFKNYQAFLRAFLSGEVERLVVVARLAGSPARAARAGHRNVDRYALNTW